VYIAPAAFLCCVVGFIALRAVPTALAVVLVVSHRAVDAHLVHGVAEKGAARGGGRDLIGLAGEGFEYLGGAKRTTKI